MGHPEGQPRGPCGATSLSVHAQGNLHPVGHHWAPDASRAATSARRGSGTQETKPGAPTAQRRCSSAPRGSRAQWAAAGACAEQGTWGSGTWKHREARCGRPEDRGVWTAKTVKRPPQQPTQPQYANYWAPLTRKRHTMPHPAQPQHTNQWAPRTRTQHQQGLRPQRAPKRQQLAVAAPPLCTSTTQALKPTVTWGHRVETRPCLCLAEGMPYSWGCL